MDNQLLLTKYKESVVFLRKSIQDTLNSLTKESQLALKIRVRNYLKCISSQERIVVEMEQAVKLNNINNFNLLADKFEKISTFIKEDAVEMAAEAKGITPDRNKDIIH